MKLKQSKYFYTFRYLEQLSLGLVKFFKGVVLGPIGKKICAKGLFSKIIEINN